MPLVLHKFLEDGRADRILQDLNNIIVTKETREDMYGDIGDYFLDWYGHQTWWAIKLVLCNLLNLINIIVNILLVDWYLGGMFFPYGIISLEVCSMYYIRIKGFKETLNYSSSP